MGSGVNKIEGCLELLGSRKCNLSHQQIKAFIYEVKVDVGVQFGASFISIFQSWRLQAVRPDVVCSHLGM